MKRLVSALLACVLISSTTAVLASEQISEELKGALRKGHGLTCIPVIEDQFKRMGMNQHYTKIAQYCTCLGIQYFRDMSVAELKEMQASNSLPKRISRKRSQIQDWCREKHIKQ